MTQKRPRYLTKSKYKLALECPTKLYYGAHPELYENADINDAFLQELARGGFQVGELAKCYFPGGTAVETLAYDEAVEITEQLLKQDEVIIYEPALRFGEFFVRVDILIKKGKKVRLLEVKAKSFHPEEDEVWDKNLLKKDIYKISKNWKPYVYDIAFQTFVAQKAHPEFDIHPYLCLVDKSKVTSVDSLNQRFFLGTENGRTKVTIKGDVSLKGLGEKILYELDLKAGVERILAGKDLGEADRKQLGLPSFEAEATSWAKLYVEDQKAEPKLSAACKKCEFRQDLRADLRDGVKECWSKHLSAAELEEPNVLDIWFFKKTDELIANGKLLMRHLTRDDINIKESESEGLSMSERQWLQVECAAHGKTEEFVKRDALIGAIKAWKFPLHFIDFETARPALPFQAKKRPYEQYAFQFSHHVVHADGRIEHVDQYLHDVQGEFPNFHFVRALKKSLEHDDGTIFRYSAHENTVLCDILAQLEKSSEPDRQELIEWIKSITEKKDRKVVLWEGSRNMVDLLKIIKMYYYHPATDGSNSIKRVLPAILSSSQFLRDKYSKPLYGHSQGMKSLNFENQTWLLIGKDGQVLDPYKLLPPIFEGYDTQQIDILMGDEELQNGGAATTAYAKMQFTEMSAMERQALRAALLKYCELDTLAMVMLYEHWVDLLGLRKKGQVA